ncbi:MAG: hypothetical protein Ct9H300mP8_05010 [Gammaproteobacteria bacterium]|nr:MAG: hypothetical protein Ct9H300mP8_05010 [Gammaproteobacteria bacterium]
MNVDPSDIVIGMRLRPYFDQVPSDNVVALSARLIRWGPLGSNANLIPKFEKLFKGFELSTVNRRRHDDGCLYPGIKPCLYSVPDTGRRAE